MSAPHEDGDARDEEFGEFGELAELLRDRLHQAVAGLEPVPGTLEYLKRAVPARRRRRHATLAATAVSVFAVSAGVTFAARGSFGTGPRQAGGANVGNLLTTATNDAPGGGSGHNPATADSQNVSVIGSPASQAPASSASVSGTTKPTQSQSAVPPSATGSVPTGACQSSSVAAVAATQSSVTGGITYENFVGTVKSSCALSGLPNLAVSGAGGTPVRVPVYQADPAAAPLLTTVPSGQTLVFQPGDRFEFQLAWVPTACAVNPTPPTLPTSVPSSSQNPTPAATPSGATPSGPTSSASGQPTPSGTPSSSAPSPKSYLVSYAVSGTQTAQGVNFTADCGATVYVTDYFAASGPKHSGQQESTATSTAGN